MNVRIFWVRAMKCTCAQTRPRFILSSEGVFGGMEFEPLLTPREKSPLPENVPRGGSNPRRCGQRAQALPTELFRPPSLLSKFSRGACPWTPVDISSFFFFFFFFSNSRLCFRSCFSMYTFALAVRTLSPWCSVSTLLCCTRVPWGWSSVMRYDCLQALGVVSSDETSIFPLEWSSF